MADEPLYPAGEYLFEVHGGAQTRAGKVYYPALLRLDLSRRDALDLANQLIRFACDAATRRQFTFSGAIFQVTGPAGK